MSQPPGAPSSPYTAPYAPPPLPVKRHRVRNWLFGIGGGIVVLLIGVAIGSPPSAGGCAILSKLASASMPCHLQPAGPAPPPRSNCR